MSFVSDDMGKTFHECATGGPSKDGKEPRKSIMQSLAEVTAREPRPGLPSRTGISTYKVAKPDEYEMGM